MLDTRVTCLLLASVGLLQPEPVSGALQTWTPISRGHRTAKSYDLKKQSPKSQHWIERRTANYNSDNNNDNVDLHNKEFCVDVSTYQPVVWQEVDAEQCDTVFVKQCEDKTEEVCADVTETRCQVVPYTECEMGMEPQEYTTSVLQPKLFVEKTCTQGRKMIPHVKMLPECRNVTKQNCVTLWETDAEGKQQWAGNEACEPVTCEVKHSTSCESQTRPDCKKI